MFVVHVTVCLVFERIVCTALCFQPLFSSVCMCVWVWGDLSSTSRYIRPIICISFHFTNDLKGLWSVACLLSGILLSGNILFVLHSAECRCKQINAVKHAYVLRTCSGRYGGSI